MPAVAARATVHSLRLEKAAEPGTVLAARLPFSLKVSQAATCNSCVVLRHHHIHPDNHRMRLFANASRFTHHQTSFLSHASTDVQNHPSFLRKLQFRCSKARRPADVDFTEDKKRQRRVTIQAVPSSVRCHLGLSPSSFSQTRYAAAICTEHRNRRQSVATQAIRASVPLSLSRARPAATLCGKHIKRDRRVTRQAVRVEDLSPAAPTPDEEEPVQVKVPVGFVGETSDTAFAVRKLLPQPSVLLTVTLPKPLGIVFEESRIRKRITVAELVAGGNAERLARVVQMFGSVTRASRDGAPVRTVAAVQVGDVLRGLTTTQCIVDLFGVRAPRRATVYFDTRNRRWGEIMGAFGAVKVSDGEITLVLERKLERSQVQ